MSEPVTRRLIYHGEVQGVGFRATTHRFAQGFLVDGSVRNLPDGTVELIVRGDRHEVERLLSRVQNHFSTKISAIDQVDFPQGNITKGFTIRN
ncbi:MAG: acylphosphatase [Planctomycetaceae bacterium]